MRGRIDNHVRFVARITIEALSPFLVGTGEGDGRADAGFAADANGLPLLPGASIAGVLRRLYARTAPAGSVDDVFGVLGARASRLSVSCGAIHDANGQPVEGLVRQAHILADDVLRDARESTVRDHVRITHRGAAASGGKFDERVVAAGHRFTFELMLAGSKGDVEHWNTLLALVSSDALRIGGKTRRGMGRFKVQRIMTRIFDLTHQDDLEAFRLLPVSLAASNGLQEQPLPSERALAAGQVVAMLKLEPDGFWFFGGGDDERVDLAPVRQSAIAWDTETGSGSVVRDQFYIPGTSIKGALAHRTAFWRNVEDGMWADQPREGEAPLDPESISSSNNESVKELFGYVDVSRRSQRSNAKGARGRVTIDDVPLGAGPAMSKVVPHVSIDRFTGGARTKLGALFSERPFFKSTAPIELRIVVDDSNVVSDKSRRALGRALDDLARGMLPLGAGASRGNGVFMAPQGVEWSDGGSWMRGEGGAI